MTEDEAKTKWCPLNRTRVFVNSEEPFKAPVGAKCIGSACMMWREHVVIDADRKGADSPDGTGWKWSGVAWAHTSGHCGLAGKP